MGTSIWKIAVLLPNNEGDIYLLLQQYEQPNRKDAGQYFLDSDEFTYIHGDICRGSIRFIDITRSKQALCCERCNLRLTFPRHIRRVSDLDWHFNSKDVVDVRIAGSELDGVAVKNL